MRILRLILVLAVVAGSFVGPGELAVAAAQAGDASCCCEGIDPAAPARGCDENRDGRHCDGDCPMTCCRTVTAPAEPAVISIAQSTVAVGLILPPPLAHDLSEPSSIFHPPRA